MFDFTVAAGGQHCTLTAVERTCYCLSLGGHYDNVPVAVLAPSMDRFPIYSFLIAEPSLMFGK